MFVVTKVFSNASTANIKNLKVDGTIKTVNTGASNIGSVVGVNKGGTIENCESSVDITALKSCQVAGKCCDSSVVTNSVNNGTIVGIAQVGGIAGRHVGKATLDGCTNNGNVYCTSTATTVGQIYGHNGATVTNCIENGSSGLYNN